MSWLCFLSSLVLILTFFFKKRKKSLFSAKTSDRILPPYHLIATTSPGWAEIFWPGWKNKVKFFFSHFFLLFFFCFFSSSFLHLLLSSSLSFMAGRADGSAIKALFSPVKGDPPPQVKKKKESPSTKNAPSPDQKEEKNTPKKITLQGKKITRRKRK